MPLPRYFVSKLAITAAGALLAAALAFGLVAVYFMPGLPDISDKQTFQLKMPLRIFSADKVLIGEYSEERRIPLSIRNTPQTLIDAVLAAEDANFYSHHGVAIKGLFRAALSNYRAHGKSQGASTITMQVARNFFLSPEKTYTRKIKEILLAFKIERQFSKDEILELYLNKIFLGHRAYGFGAAAKVYYGRDIKNLTLPEYAMLAALPKAPSRNNPLSRPDNAKQRRNYVLRRMHKINLITDEQLEQASNAPITASRHVKKVDHESPYVAEMARQYAIEKYGDRAYESGLSIHTTVTVRNQEAARRALQKGLLAFTRRHGYRGPAGKLDDKQLSSKDSIASALSAFPSVGPLIPAVVLSNNNKETTVSTYRGETLGLKRKDMDWAMTRASNKGAIAASKLARGDVVYVENMDAKGWKLAQVPAVSGALVSLRPADGAILSLVGGFSYYQSKYNRAVQAQRQPGSNIKPFIYSAALDHGFTPSTPISGAPVVVHDDATGEDWRPQNYSKKFIGLVPMRTALAKSMNLVSIRILRSIGVETAIKHLEKFGFDPARLPRNLSLALGTASLTPLEIATGFAEFANMGEKINPWFISRIDNAQGETIEEHVLQPLCGDSQQAASTAADKQEAGPAPKCRPRVISPRNAYLMTGMMQGVIQYGTGTRAKELGRSDIAGKTGTTNEQKDAWFSGFNPDIQATVWVGYDQPRPMGGKEFGGRAALPIWIDYMRTALDGIPERTLNPPADINTRWADKNTGATATADETVDFADNQPAETMTQADDNTAPAQSTQPAQISQPLSQPADQEDLF